MKATLLGQFEVESDEWWAARAGRLGGSEIAAVLGLSPYESRFSLWCRKKGLIGHAEMNPEMEWGQRLEAAVRRKYLESHPEVSPIGRGVFVNVDRPYQLASPDERLAVFNTDGQIVDHEILETKTSPFGEGWGPGPDDVPVYVRCQSMWYLDVFGWARARIAVLISGCDYREYTVEYDPAEAQLLRDAADEFIWTLNNNIRPDIDGDDSTYLAIRELHPLINGDRIDVDDTVGVEFIASKLDLETATTRHRKARSVLADVMGDARVAFWAEKKIADRRAKSLTDVPYVQSASATALPKIPTMEGIPS